MEKSNEDTLSEVRRYLTDLMVFEGGKFVVPIEVKAEKIVAPVGEEVAPPQAAEPIIGQMAPAEEIVAAVRKEADADAMDLPTPATAIVAAADGKAPGQAEDPIADDGNALEIFRQQICDCSKCSLCSTRQNFVFGAGNPAAGIMFVGEAPGADEDRQGEPFVGAAGQLLNKIISAMDLRREDVYICNILKCRPPNNRDPQPDEIEQCEPYLKRQIELIQPKVICTLGRFAAQTLLRSSDSMGHMRGQSHQYEGIPLVATYHPAALLRNAQWKRPTWEDMKRVRQIYDGVEL
ncbi:MAG: uracil-DNA glycosylase [Candidatus Latescibacterota bacterium]|nr:uracil-DNA glycosylase [Candidatus Latescibacterota bacterium]